MIIIKYFFFEEKTLVSIERDEKLRYYTLKKRGASLKRLADFIVSKEKDFLISIKFIGNDCMRIIMVNKNVSNFSVLS